MPEQRFNLISIHEAIDILGVSRSTFDRWRKLKRLPFTKFGKEILIDKDELERWVRHHSSGMQPPASASQAAKEFQPQLPLMVTVGYQSASAHVWTSLIMKELGWFEEELAHMTFESPVQVRWNDAANGPALVKGMIGGHIHIASLGDYPIALGCSLGQVLPAFRPILLAFDGKTSGGKGISLVVRKGLNIRHDSQISDLKISTVAQSSPGYRLSKLLGSIGGHPNQIVHKELDESMEGIVSRQIEGSVLVEPYLSLVQHHGTGQVLFQEGMGEDYLTGIVVEESWAKHNREITVAYLKAHIRVHMLIRKDPSRVAQIIARARGIPAILVSRIIAKVRWDSALYAKDLRTLRVLNKENRLIGGGLFVCDGEIKYNKEYLDRAIHALKLPLLNDSVLEGEWAHEQIY